MRSFCCLLFMIFWLMPVLTQAQKMNADSLRKVVRTSKADTAVSNAQYELAVIARKQGKNDSAYHFAIQSLERSQKGHYRKGEARANYQLGILASGKNDPVKAMGYFSVAIDIFDSLSERKLYASAIQAFGNQKMLLGDYPAALEYQLKSLRIKQELGDSTVMASAYMSLGNTYHSSGDNPRAANAFLHAIALDTLYGDRRQSGTGYYNLGNVEFELHHDSIALLYTNRAIAIGEAEHDASLLSYAYGRLGKYYFNQKEYDQALKYHEKSLELARQSEDTRVVVSELGSLGLTHQALGNAALGEQLLKEALAISSDSSMRESRVQVYSSLSAFYAAAGKFEEALKYMQLFTALRDSLVNFERSKDLTRKEMNFEFEKKRALDKAEQLKNEALYEEDRKRKLLVIYSGGGFLLLVLVFLAFVFNRYKVSQRQKTLIAAQKTEVEKQKSVIEEKNKDITDSINYAKRIQSAILPQVSEFATAFPDSFVFYRPKDIVSGDFYWIAVTPHYAFYATADCTGHGVPGGFMSVLGASLLNEIVNDKGESEPAAILNMMRERIIFALRQKGESGENKDGMDMVLCRIDRGRKELVYAAANNPLWIVRKGELQEFPADKQPVGIGAINQRNFTQHTVPLFPGDVIYTFTDGYADQFGGPKGKKFKYAQLKNVLLEDSGSSLREKESQLSRTFDAWRGTLEQVDDVLVIGIRI